ncbi:MAG: VOC family protein [Christensenellaceae bacterium]
MNFRMVHNNINVSELDKSLDFYAKALDLEETRRLEDEDYIIVYLR